MFWRTVACWLVACSQVRRRRAVVVRQFKNQLFYVGLRQKGLDPFTLYRKRYDAVCRDAIWDER